MTIFTRAVLQQAFPHSPRAVAEFEKLDDLLSAVDDKGQTLLERLDGLAAQMDDGGPSAVSGLLEAIASLPNRIGAIEVTQDAAAAIRPIDGQDPASLISRGVAYTVFVGIGGRGPTLSRPVLPAKAGAIYFDTDLDPDGQPIFWTGIKWVDAKGIPV